MPGARTVAIACCGTSAGLHGALFVVHTRNLPVYAASFLTATLLLLLGGLVLALRPDVREGPAAAAVLFAGLLVAYALFRHEPFDAVAAVSKGAEAVGLLACLRLARGYGLAPVPAPGVVSLFLLFVAAGLMVGGGHAGHG
jgi:hypothetical protein